MLKIISISGLDGSGKSTQINLLKNHLESQNKKIFYFHAINFSIASKILRNNTRISSNSGNDSVVKAGWFKITLRKIALRIDLIRFIFLILKLKYENYDYLLTDRYFYDSIINIQYLSGNFNWNLNIPTPSLAFYLKINPEIIMRRERKPEQGIEYLVAKKALYDKATDTWNMKVINGNQSKEEVFEEIKGNLNF